MFPLPLDSGYVYHCKNFFFFFSLSKKSFRFCIMKLFNFLFIQTLNFLEIFHMLDTWFFLLFQFCDVVEVAIIHKRLQPNLAFTLDMKVEKTLESFYTFGDLAKLIIKSSDLEIVFFKICQIWAIFFIKNPLCRLKSYPSIFLSTYWNLS